MTPSEHLAAWRSEHGLSQSQAAAALGVSVRTLQGWELGRRMPYPKLLELACKQVGRRKRAS
jgi:transcriptional regulator with XRE-family HTH domain